jgi:hypothetical protein
MNIDADSLAEHFWLLMVDRKILPLEQGLNNPLLAVTLLIDGTCIPSHYSHRIPSSFQKWKHRQYLQDKHGWTDTVWHTLDFGALKSAFLTLDPIKQVSCSQRIHGWLNTGTQKQHISQTAVDAHQCPRCKLTIETQEHVLQCTHSSAHKWQYELLLPMKCRILTVPGCKAQQLFFSCLRSWPAHPDNITPDISHLPMEQRPLIALALRNNMPFIGWDLCFCGHLSRHWALAVAAHPSQPNPTNNYAAKKPLDTGKTWARKTIYQLWEFGQEMWLHLNSTLHDPTIVECRQMKGATLNAAITALYGNVDTYAFQD